MASDAYVDALVTEGERLAEAVGRSPSAVIRRYPTWSAADLGRHVGAIHRWVTTLVATSARHRLPQPDVSGVADQDVADWLSVGCDRLVAVLASTQPSAAVWTFGDGPDTTAFWRRRMAVETALHRWDAQDASGDTDPVAEWLAVDAVDEAFDIYLFPRLAGAAVGGQGERILLDCGAATWSLRLEPSELVADTSGGPHDAIIRGSPLAAWLLLSGRASLAELTVDGDRAAAEQFVAAANQVPGPA